MKKMARVTSLILLLFVALATDLSFAAGPRTFGKKGVATGTNATITAPFHPVMFCIRNDDATDGLYYDWTDGVASTVDESTNLFLPPGIGECWTFVSNRSPFEEFKVGVISTGTGTDYHFNISRAN